VIDATTHKLLKSIKLKGTAPKPMGIAVAPSGDYAYVTTGRGGHLQVIDVAADTVVAFLEVGTRPWGLAVTPDGKKAYTANGPGNDVSVVDLETRKLLRRVPSPGLPWGVAIGD